MRKIIFFVLFFLTIYSNAQKAQDIIDGLKKDLKANPDAKKRATIYSDLTWYYSNISLDSALAYGKKAIVESTKLKDSTLIAQVYSDMGAVYFGIGNFNKSKENYFKAYKIRKSINDLEGLIKIKFNLASIYTKQDNYVEAVKIYLETIKYYENKRNDTLVSVSKSNLASVFLEMDNFTKTFKYVNEAIVFQEKNKLFDRLCNSYLVLGNYYIKKNDTILGIKYYEKTLNVAKISKNNMSISAICQSLGDIKSAQKNTKEALFYFNQSKEVLKTLNSTSELSYLDFCISVELIKIKKYFEAKKILLSSKNFYENQNSKGPLIDIYKQLSIVSSFLNQPDTTNFYIEKYSRLKIALSQIDVLKQTAELETKYQTAKKEKQIIEQQAQAKQKNIYLFGLSFLALLTGLIGFLIFKQQKQKNQQQAQENQLKSAIAEIENQNKLQEQRLSISRDLHDNIGAQLTFIISSVDSVKYGFDITNKKLDNKLTNISGFAKDTIVELRDTIWAMNSNAITFEDLEARINNYIEKAKVAQDNISFSFAIDTDLKTQKLSSVEGMNIYRTIQEAVNNSLKYATANIISINAKKVDNQIKITIADNGQGFDINEIEKGNGLNNMKKRIEEIGGVFEINSDKDGTKIIVLINS